MIAFRFDPVNLVTEMFSVHARRFALLKTENVIDSIACFNTMSIIFVTQLNRQIVCFPMGTNCFSCIGFAFVFGRKRFSDFQHAESICTFSSTS